MSREREREERKKKTTEGEKEDDKTREMEERGLKEPRNLSGLLALRSLLDDFIILSCGLLLWCCNHSPPSKSHQHSVFREMKGRGGEGLTILQV